MKKIQEIHKEQHQDEPAERLPHAAPEPGATQPASQPLHDLSEPFQDHFDLYGPGEPTVGAFWNQNPTIDFKQLKSDFGIPDSPNDLTSLSEPQEPVKPTKVSSWVEEQKHLKQLKTAIEQHDGNEVEALINRHPDIDYLSDGAAIYDAVMALREVHLASDNREQKLDSGIKIVNLLLAHYTGPEDGSLRRDNIKGALHRVLTDTLLPASRKITLAKEMLNNGATLDAELLRSFVAHGYQPEVIEAMLAVITQAEKEKLHTRVAGLLAGQEALKTNLPNDIVNIVSKMVIQQLVEEHMIDVRNILSNLRAVFDLSSAPTRYPTEVYPDKSTYVDELGSSASLERIRAEVQATIQRTVFNKP